MRPSLHVSASVTASMTASVTASVSASMHAARAAFSTALVCAALTALAPPAHAAYLEQDFLEATGRLQRSIGSLAAASHIVLAAQTADTLPPYASALVDIALSTDPAELKKLVERAVDVALSLPPDAVAAAKGEVKEAFSGLKPGSCELVPLPMATFDRVLASEAVSSSASRLKELSEQWTPALIPQTDAGVCLPPPERLEKLLGVQTDAFAAADKAKVHELELQSALTLGTVQKGERFRLFSQLGKRQLATLSRANFVARDQFKKASAEYLEARRFVEELKQKRADGPPKCFTIGCTVFYENDVRRCFGSRAQIGSHIGSRAQIGSQIGSRDQIGAQIGSRAQIGSQIGSRAQIGSQIGSRAQIGAQIGSRALARACCLALPLPRRCSDPSVALTPPPVRVFLSCACRYGATTTRTTTLERALRSPTAS